MIVRLFLYFSYAILLIFQTNFSFAEQKKNNYLNKDSSVFFNGTDIKQDSVGPPLLFINTAFENASPLNWEVTPEGTILLNLVYDHERASPNKSIYHCLFQVQARERSDLTFIIQDYRNVYNGRSTSLISDRTKCYISRDGKKWIPIPTEKVDGNGLKFNIHMEGSSLYIAAEEPYRLSDLNNLLTKISKHPLVKITPIGKTVEGRQLEIIRLGNSNAPYRIFLRGRAHSSEAGGSWLLQGLINSLLQNNKDATRYLKKYCLYILPMANKDGVARGKSRFNSMGADLNRNWNKPADPILAPENDALERWLKTMINQGMKPHLIIDLHDDAYGGLHISRPPNVNLEQYLSNMERFESLLNQYSWFTEGSTGADFRDGAGSIGEGLLERYGIDGCIFEVNHEWAAGLNKAPVGQDWELMGKQFSEVFFQYFNVKK